MNINASELGMSFVKVCFALFQDKSYFLYLASVCLIYLLIRKKEPWKPFWGLYGAFLLLIIFNPLIWRVVDLLVLDDEYYRFLWLIPVTPLIAYSATVLIMKAEKRMVRRLAFVGAVVVIVFCGQSVFSRSWELIDNIHKIPDEVIEICEIIRADCDKEEPVVASDFELSVLLNQYAPDIDLLLSYREVDKIRTLEAQGIHLDNAEKRMYYILIAGDEYEYVFRDGYLDYALEEGEIDYVVTSRWNPARAHIASSECELIAELDEYCIFRSALKEK